MPRFVLLEHDHPIRHWDLMLEVGPVLWTWRLDAIPILGVSCQASRVADHRLIYLDYEGSIGGNRGEVRRVADGEFAWVEDTPCRIVIRVRGASFSGAFTLERGQGGEWTLNYCPKE